MCREYEQQLFRHTICEGFGRIEVDGTVPEITYDRWTGTLTIGCTTISSAAWSKLVKMLSDFKDDSRLIYLQHKG